MGHKLNRKRNVAWVFFFLWLRMVKKFMILLVYGSGNGFIIANFSPQWLFNMDRNRISFMAVQPFCMNVTRGDCLWFSRVDKLDISKGFIVLVRKLLESLSQQCGIVILNLFRKSLVASFLLRKKKGSVIERNTRSSTLKSLIKIKYWKNNVSIAAVPMTMLYHRIII